MSTALVVLVAMFCALSVYFWVLILRLFDRTAEQGQSIRYLLERLRETDNRVYELQKAAKETTQ